MDLHGIHHLTAITANARANYAFYTDVLGMRLVKKTVNQDDVSAYHLFYADGKGSPGTDLTFFDWATPPEQRGTHSIVGTGLRVTGESSFRWWIDRFRDRNVRHGGIVERDGRLTLDFEDPEGQRLSLIEDGGIGETFPWEKSPVPTKYQVRGLGPIVISVPKLARTERILQDVLGMRLARQYAATNASNVSTFTKWVLAVPPQNCMWPWSPSCRSHSKGQAACTMSRCAQPATTTMHGWLTWRRLTSHQAVRSTASISAASIFAIPTVFFSKSPQTDPALRLTNRWNRWEKASRFPRFSSIVVGRSSLGSKSSTKAQTHPSEGTRRNTIDA